MPAELHPAATHPPRLTLDADTLAALRDLALECALAADAAAVREVLGRRAGRLDGASVLAVLTRMDGVPPGPLAELCVRAVQEGRVCVAGPDATLPAPDGLHRAVAAPMRVHGEPAALALGWARSDPGVERAWTLAEAVAEQAGVALTAASRLVELRDAAFRRDRFFSAMSHDLRTPITAIVGYSELLQDGIVGELTDRQQEMVQRICQVSGELAQLVTDMLDLAKLDAGRMEFHRETVTLGAVLESGLEGAEPQLEATGSRLERGELRDVECPVEVDRPRIRQVVASMVSHAAHAAPGGEVRVTAGCDGGDLRVEVSDAGPTLAAGCEEALFEALPRGALRETRAGPGAALSLALSRRIARAMGGELEARGLPGQGMALTLRLPRGVA
jgi:signal transduction histidine kinase